MATRKTVRPGSQDQRKYFYDKQQEIQAKQHKLMAILIDGGFDKESPMYRELLAESEALSEEYRHMQNGFFSTYSPYRATRLAKTF